MQLNLIHICYQHQNCPMLQQTLNQQCWNSPVHERTIHSKIRQMGELAVPKVLSKDLKHSILYTLDPFSFCGFQQLLNKGLKNGHSFTKGQMKCNERRHKTHYSEPFGIWKVYVESRQMVHRKLFASRSRDTDEENKYRDTKVGKEKRGELRDRDWHMYHI